MALWKCVCTNATKAHFFWTEAKLVWRRGSHPSYISRWEPCENPCDPQIHISISCLDPTSSHIFHRVPRLLLMIFVSVWSLQMVYQCSSISGFWVQLLKRKSCESALLDGEAPSWAAETAGCHIENPYMILSYINIYQLLSISSIRSVVGTSSFFSFEKIPGYPWTSPMLESDFWPLG